MLSDTLTEGLARYEIGPKIRSLRRAKKLGLAQLGEHTGLSPGLLSKIERSQMFPTLPTLLRIAMVFGVGLEHFFVPEEEPKVAVMRKADRLRFPDSAEAARPNYYFESLDYTAVDRSMSAYRAEFEALEPEDTVLHQHDGDELLYVLAGELTVTVAGTDHVLGAGDSMYFDAGHPHGYRRSGGEICAAIVVTADNAANTTPGARRGSAPPGRDARETKDPL